MLEKRKIFKPAKKYLTLPFTTSHKYKFAWFRTPKVASRSILIHMLHELQEQDPEAFDEKEFKEWTGIKEFPGEFDNDPELIAPLGIRRGNRKSYPADYFVFAFVRNPWDRISSCYRNKVDGYYRDYKTPKFMLERGLDFHHERAPWISFREFLELLLRDDETKYWNEHWAPQTALINMDQLDFVGKLETLDKDWKYVCEKIGIEHKSLGNYNSTKENDETYRKFYEEQEDDKQFCIDAITELYKEEIEKFNYKY
jgi:chondroitin 4-sulfotransferase 11